MAGPEKAKGLEAGELVRITVLYSLLGGATACAFVASVLIDKSFVVLAGLGIISYVFGLRHGFDADHIAAIDNVTRKLMQEGKKPLAVGIWFSLGHSTIVFGLIFALVLSTRAIMDSIVNLQGVGVILGTTISGLFLCIIGIINVVIVLGIYRIFLTLRQEKLNQSQLEELLGRRGFMNRYFGFLLKLITKPRHIYPIGLLFGLGFDTASEIALIAVSVGIGVASSVPVWTILVLPLMFTCGMVLVDASDAVAMRFAYSWAFLKPIRKVYYNLTITIISVLVAFFIGAIELLQVMSVELNLSGTFWGWFSKLDFETMGAGVVGVFVVSWLVSIGYYWIKRLEETMPSIT